jgi:hypothetical protein
MGRTCLSIFMHGELRSKIIATHFFSFSIRSGASPSSGKKTYLLQVRVTSRRICLPPPHDFHSVPALLNHATRLSL